MGDVRKTSWLEHRTGAGAASHQFMTEKIPASTGWRNTFGSLAGALLLFQVLTGFLLALYYVPHPEAAYQSVEYIERELTLGWFVRALHYWGASFIVVALFLHVVRVFWTGAYKPPRELTWIVGIILLGVTLTLAFTGQLLPYNQMGYWAANVGVEIAASTPLLGPRVRDLMLGGDTIGALTLTRFYALHIVLLPAMLGLLVGLHLYLLRRHGPTRTHRDTTDRTVHFYPAQVYRDAVVSSIGLAALMLFSAWAGSPQVGPYDPADTSFTPHPEWYFMAHYQILRVTPGPYKVFATFVLPNLIILFLIALPWLDRGRTGAWRDRRTVLTVGTAGLAVAVALTLYGTLNRPTETAAVSIAGTADEEDVIAFGRRVYVEQNCQKCHRIGDEGRATGRTAGPDLTNAGLRLQPDFLRAFLPDPDAFYPGSRMPPTQVNARELEALIAYLMAQTGTPEPR